LDFVKQQAALALGLPMAISKGLCIYTTLDLGIQNTAEATLQHQLHRVEEMSEFSSKHQTYLRYFRENHTTEEDIRHGHTNLRFLAPKYLQGAVLAVDNDSGGILAMVGGRDYRHSEYNRTFQAHRESGTALLPFVYLAAYNEGVSPWKNLAGYLPG
jgi:penicillin-binding protein 1A